MRIFLIGMPGSGKSTIGRILSESLDLAVYDLDKLIEEEAGMSIPEIFQVGGEEGFRLREKRALQAIIKEKSAGIISTGGGAPCFYDNLEQMQKAGRTVYIDVPLETLIARTTKTSKRPLLQGNHEERIAQLLTEREYIYKQAEIVFETAGRDSSEVAREIAAYFKNL